MSKKITIFFLSLIIFISAVQIVSSLSVSPTPDISAVEEPLSTSTIEILKEESPTLTEQTTIKTEEDSKPKSESTNQVEQEITPTATEQQTIATTTNTEVNFEPINILARKATVNIICMTNSGSLSPISGSGIIISSNGLILTNAHIAQYFLLLNLYEKDFIKCTIRTGSPTYPRYYAELVYISPKWVEDNKAEITEQNPLGTGENDYAFLHITSAIDGSALPQFSYLPVNTREKIDLNEPVVLVSYPAGFLGGLTILQGLSVTSAITNIQNVFTFKENTIDVVAVGGTMVSQKGASGGAVIDKNSSLIGMISTSSSGETTDSRELNAITMAYINKNLQETIGFGLSDFISQDLTIFTRNFQITTAPILTKLLTDEIIKSQ